MRMPTLRPFGEGCMSGEAIDTRTRSIRPGSEHGTLRVALKDDLAAGGKFRVIVPACRPDPCSRSKSSLPANSVRCPIAAAHSVRAEIPGKGTSHDTNPKGRIDYFDASIRFCINQRTSR